MPSPHINDDLLDRYASGNLAQELVADLEEHLLICPECQTQLIAADEFIGLFRAAATQPDARPQPILRRLFHTRVLAWTGAAAMAAVAFFLVSVESRKLPLAPATVFMHSVRGPEAAPAIPAGKPARLVFDFTPTGAARDYEVHIVNLLGTQVQAIPVELDNGHLSILIKKLALGSYWVRVYSRVNNDLIVEYGLRTE